MIVSSNEPLEVDGLLDELDPVGVDEPTVVQLVVVLIVAVLVGVREVEGDETRRRALVAEHPPFCDEGLALFRSFVMLANTCRLSSRGDPAP